MITGCPDDQNISFQNSIRDLLISNRASARIRTRVDDRSPQRQGSCSNIRCHHIEKKQKMFLMYIRRSENTRDCWDIISLINGGEWNEVWLSGYKADHLCTVHDQRYKRSHPIRGQHNAHLANERAVSQLVWIILPFLTVLTSFIIDFRSYPGHQPGHQYQSDDAKRKKIISQWKNKQNDTLGLLFYLSPWDWWMKPLIIMS